MIRNKSLLLRKACFFTYKEQERAKKRPASIPIKCELGIWQISYDSEKTPFWYDSTSKAELILASLKLILRKALHC
jgi:hypothetical protein